jgi:hypothetical protein
MHHLKRVHYLAQAFSMTVALPVTQVMAIEQELQLNLLCSLVSQ